MPDHEALRALLQDRKSSTKGRASRRMAICLSAELSADFENAERELAEAKEAADAARNTGDRRLGAAPGDPELDKRVELAEKAVAAAEKAADEASVIITFTALKAHEYDDLLKKHPPRDDNDLDKLHDYNRDTFPDALMAASASPKVEDNDGNLVDIDITDLIDGMSNGERILACQVAGDVNDRTSSFSEAKSLSRRRSGSNSKRR